VSTAQTPVDPSPAGRRTDVANAVLGNGALLVTLSARGEVEAAWWPHVDRERQLRELRLGVIVDGTTRWLDEDASWRQRYLDDTSVLVTEVDLGDLQVTVTDLVDPDEPVLRRQVVASQPVRVVASCVPSIGGSVTKTGGYVDRRTETLVFHGRDQVLALATDEPWQAGAGEIQRRSDVADALAAGRPPAMSYAHGIAEGGLVTERPSEATVLAVAFASDHDTAISRATKGARAPFEEAVARRRDQDAAGLALGQAPIRDDAAALYRRSQLVFGLMTDRATGGLIAGPEVDEEFVRCGGYAFVWARDVAFCSLAFIAAGRHDLTAATLRWLARHQNGDGLWLQRQWTDGALAPSWGVQLDETGAVLAAYDAAHRVLGDDELDAHLWPSAERAAEALVATIDHDTGLPLPSMDPWEERFGQHAYTAACHVAGLRAAAAMARRHAPELAAGYAEAAAQVAAAIDEHLWSDEHGRYLRGINVERRHGVGAEPAPLCYERIPPHPGRRVTTVDPFDATVDVSLLGLGWPFGAVAADGERAQATFRAVAEQARAADGGILRYAGDRYIGGNPWMLATLWAGLHQRAAGDDRELDHAVRYAIAKQTSTQLLPEQVDAATGRPRWVVPLTWSHAMLVLACRPDVAAG
jgi:glucoamylase